MMATKQKLFSMIGIVFVCGCQAIGTGSSVLVREVDRDNAREHFPNYIVPSTQSTMAERMIGVPPETSTNPARFTRFMEAKYGLPRFEPARLSASIRDRDTIPPFLPTDTNKMLMEKIAALMSDDSKLTQTQKIAKEKLLRARLSNVPDLTETTTLHHIESGSGRKVFYYYPRVQIDFSSQLVSNSYLDRFSFLGLAIKLKSDVKNDNGDKVRFIDFQPKDADIVEFTRGNFSQQAALAANGSFGTKQGGSQTSTIPIPGLEGGSVVGASASERTMGGALSYTQTEAYVSELTDSIEQRTTSILDDGKVFLAEFRSVREKRIGGTYNFDLMLEIPSNVVDVKGMSGTYESEPIIDTKLRADIYLLGVVRHVDRRGTKGVLIRVPESENDDVYETVTLDVLEDQRIWQFSGIKWFGDDFVVKHQMKLTVVSNREDARYILTESKAGVDVLVGEGGGKKTVFSIDIPGPAPPPPPAPAPTRSFTLTYLPIVSQSGTGPAVKLLAPGAFTFTAPIGTPSAQHSVGDYYL